MAAAGVNEKCTGDAFHAELITYVKMGLGLASVSTDFGLGSVSSVFKHLVQVHQKISVRNGSQVHEDLLPRLLQAITR